MCGRYALTSPPEILAALFKLAAVPSIVPRYNIAPTQEAPVVRLDRQGARELLSMRWGLIPSWAKDASVGNRAINARSESAADKPLFRDAIRERRCLVPANGFYEWKKIGARAKQPYYISRADRAPLAYAGLYEHWRDPEGKMVEMVRSYTILTTQPNERLRELHDRMPVILEPEEFDAWLDPEITDPVAIAPLLDPFPGDQLDIYPVSTRVNRPANDDATLVQPVEAIEDEPRLFE